MINKQNIWFVSLFSIILVLSIFYFSMNDSSLNEFKDISYNDESQTELVLNESSELVSLRIQSDEEMQKMIEDYKNTLLSLTSTLEEKNEAYDNLLLLNSNKSTETNLEDIIYKKLNLESFVKITPSGINVVVNHKEHSYELANTIIRTVQQEFKDNKYITVKFN